MWKKCLPNRVSADAGGISLWRLGTIWPGKTRVVVPELAGGMGAETAMRRTTARRLLYFIYVIIGLIVAWERGYITVAFLKALLSALLAIFLWWLVLLGVSLHIH
jgi:hypothetical protein